MERSGSSPAASHRRCCWVHSTYMGSAISEAGAGSTGSDWVTRDRASGGLVESRPRWSRIRLPTVGSAMKAMIRRHPPHSGQASTSIAKTFLRRSAQGTRNGRCENTIVARLGENAAFERGDPLPKTGGVGCQRLVVSYPSPDAPR